MLSKRRRILCEANFDGDPRCSRAARRRPHDSYPASHNVAIVHRIRERIYHAANCPLRTPKAFALHGGQAEQASGNYKIGINASPVLLSKVEPIDLNRLGWLGEPPTKRFLSAVSPGLSTETTDATRRTLRFRFCRQ